MMAGKAQGTQQPTAFGSLLQASTYGMTAPVVYGRITSNLLATWAANLRQGGSGKKFKQMKKGITAYCENITFLAGLNPILCSLQFWSNGTKWPLDFASVSFTVGSSPDFTITDSEFYALIAVTTTESYSATFADYGDASGGGTFAGSFEVPLWNEYVNGPDPVDAASYRNFPYCYRWTRAAGNTFHVDGFGALAGQTLTAYYARLSTATAPDTPLGKMRLHEEPTLGEGDEYDGIDQSGNPLGAQQILYPQYFGFGSASIDLGSTGTIPTIQPELLGKFAVHTAGDADYVDIIEDILKSGFQQAAVGGALNFGQNQHGVSQFDFPGAIQKKMGTSVSGGGALRPLLYNLPNTPGNVLVVVVAGGAGDAPTLSSSNGEAWTALNPAGSPQQVWYASAVGGPLNTVTIGATTDPAAQALILEIAVQGGVSGGVYKAGSGTNHVALSKAGSASLYVPYTLGAYYNKFVLPTLPPDAVIVAVYPVGTFAFTTAGTNGHTYAVSGAISGVYFAGGFTGPTTGFYATDPTTGRSYGTAPGVTPAPNPHSLPGGTMTAGGQSITPGALNTLLNNQGIGVSIADSVPQQNPCWAWGGLYSGGVLTGSLTQPGFAIVYTSASAAVDTTLPAPFAIPAACGLAWALPEAMVVDAPPGTVHTCSGNVQVHSAVATLVAPSGNWYGSLPSTTGSFSFDLAAAGQGTITSTVTPGEPGFLLAIPFFSAATAPAAVAQWKPETPANSFGHSPSLFHVQSRIIHNPGSFSFAPASAPASVAMLSFTFATPPAFAAALGDFLDPFWREQARLQGRAGGLFGALSMNAQKPARDWLKDLCEAADVAPVYSGFHLKLVPRSEVSAVGNGAVYLAPTASGPVARLDADRGDFVSATPITPTRKARTDLSSVQQMQFLNRDSDYAQVTAAEVDPVASALFGVRKADPVQNNAVVTTRVARAILRIKIRRSNYVEALGYKFALNARWQHLEAMDLVTLTDRLQGIVDVPVRLTAVTENDQGALECEAEPFVYAVHAPQQLAVPTLTPYRPAVDSSAGSINAPVFLEPVPRLYNVQNQQQLWVVVSSSNPHYAGCQPMISTDGGLSYNSAGDPLAGSAVTGVTTANWAAASSPDTANNLALDLSESNGTLASYQVADQDNCLYPCYVAGGAGTIPYELMTYATATLTAAHTYTLQATGTGNHLDRGVLGAPSPGVGVAHAAGARFALLAPDGAGILKLTMDPTWIGKTLYFKFPTFNTFGSALQSLADCTAYAYTPTGLSGAVNPTGLPPQVFTVNGV